MPSEWRRHAEEAAALWRRASWPVALTGAGISVASGIPDFRSPGGLWTRYDPTRVATIQALRTDPAGVWEFLLEAVLLFERARPNPAHLALAELEAAGRLKAVITQNVDSLHQRAGSREVVEFHGSGSRFHCMGCGREHSAARVPALRRGDLPWRCDDCGQVVRPDLVFFGERIPPDVLEISWRLAARADLCVIVGTSGEVAPANTLPAQIKVSGGRVIEINLGGSAFAGVADVRIDAPCEEALPVLAGLVRA